MALEKIVATKRADVAARMAARPLASFRDAVGPSDRSLHAALSGGRTGYILECKKASPSKGVIRPDFDPVAIAKTYAPFADGISVLTDEPYFQGSLAYLRAVRDAVDVPVLCKDFVVDPYQIYEARAHGADAILLMCSVLEQHELATCLATCRELSVDALVEVHDGAELARALAAGAAIIGVNNRDLRTLEIDLCTSETLCPRVPRDKICIAESGITTRQDVLRLRDRCDAFLIGGHLMAAPHLDRAVRDIVFGRVKICGLTNVEDAGLAYAAGAHYGGFIAWPKSKRHLTARDALPLCREVPLAWVGVFVDEDPRIVGEVARELGLAAVQLHGDETREAVAAVRAALPEGCAVWKAHRTRDAIESPSRWGADRLLVDTYVEGEPGGTGRRFDWSLFTAHPEHGDMILSGGITPDTAVDADACGGYAIDLASGVESAPGRKDEDKIAALFAALRGRSRAGAQT